MIRRYFGWRAGALVVGCALGALLASAPAQAQCVGDCSGDGTVAINELITGVNIALDSANVSTCPSFDVNNDGKVAINELITAVNNALSSCPAVNTPTDTVAISTPTDTVAISTPTDTVAVSTPTDTVPPISTPTDTVAPTDTPTLPAGTATATITETPTPEGDTPTPTATEEPTAMPTVHNVCTLTAGSALQLQTAALTLPLNPTGTISVDCGAAGADGTGACSCELIHFDPVVIPAIGDVCISPAAGCEAGKVDCDGGATIDVELNADHKIGTCSSDADCEASCDAHCAALGEKFVRQSFGCEGFCQGGANDETECSRDSECPGGQCVGGEPVVHANTCNCVCSGAGLGQPSVAGGLSCSVGTQINVELPNDGICGDVVPPTIQLPAVCGPVTSETSTGIIHNSNNMSGSTIPAAGASVVHGTEVTCENFNAHNITGLKMVGQLGFFDSTLGDIRSGTTYVGQ
ncbi:MAG TPA: hypothetical protein VL049_09040 [Candidatus Dormibacteraeota bacterium]|nr:hypothetical protein [Candidatus Dormibacteraeota bacterium]